MIPFPENLPIWPNDLENAGYVIADFPILNVTGYIFLIDNSIKQPQVDGHNIRWDGENLVLAASTSSLHYYFHNITGSNLPGSGTANIGQMMDIQDINYRAVPVE